MSEGAVLELNKIRVSNKARALAARFQMDPKIAEITIRESDYIFGGISGFLLAIRDGMIAPNAGIDKSNVPPGFIILYPNDAFKSAEHQGWNCYCRQSAYANSNRHSRCGHWMRGV
jgi:coenzyme F420-0:L-glutamate ligase/coenzyme F420-1:gamma-L-glutamate ligase